jgi:UDP-N-acetylglucosamine 2-epimerase
LIARSREFVAMRGNSSIFTNLDALTYWSLLAQVELLTGNSSSGIMEAGSFALPTVNVGMRQKGRERALNVIDVAPDATAILDGIRKARSTKFRNSLTGMTNPYGDGHASERITQVLTNVPLNSRLLIKHALEVRL